MATSTRNVLITGSNRGIGHALSAKYLLRPHHTVIAVDSAYPSTSASAVSHLQAQGIMHLDLVIANAGICKCFPTVAEATLDDVRENHEVNVVGPLALFQATLPMLKSAAGGMGMFVAISSIGASVGGMEKVPVPSSAYGPSKAALNYIMRKAHFENEEICVFVIEPGWVKTEMLLNWREPRHGQAQNTLPMCLLPRSRV